MLNINKRQSEILQIIKDHSSMNVKDIIPLFDVSAATIRKDLAILEKASLILRTRGEVHMPEKTDLTPFESRSYINKNAKSIIARKAVAMIEDGDAIILDSGTTTLEIANLLENRRNITVLTNSLPIAYALSNSQLSVSLQAVCSLGEICLRRAQTLKTIFLKWKLTKCSWGLAAYGRILG